MKFRFIALSVVAQNVKEKIKKDNRYTLLAFRNKYVGSNRRFNSLKIPGVGCSVRLGAWLGWLSGQVKCKKITSVRPKGDEKG